MTISVRPVVGVSFKLLEIIIKKMYIQITYRRQEQDVFRNIKSVSSGISSSASLLYINFVLMNK